MLKRNREYLVVAMCLLMSAEAFGQRADEEGFEVIKAARQSPARKDTAELPAVTKLIIEQTNAFRKEQGRVSLTVNAKLTKATEYFADFMARTGKYGHGADGTQPADRARKYEYDFCIVAENIAYQFNSNGFAKVELVQGFVEGWKKSPGHRKNMLDPDVTEIAVAVAQSQETGYYYAVQMFGRPKSQAIAFQLENESGTTVEYKIDDQKFTLPPRYTRTHQGCRPADVTLMLPGETSDSKGESKVLRPVAGDHFVITGDKGTLQVKKE